MFRRSGRRFADKNMRQRKKVHRHCGRAARHDWRAPMASLDRRSSITAAVIAAALACWIPSAARAEDAPRADNKAGQAAAPPADAAASDMIRIEYVPPKNPKLQTPYRLVQE